MLKIIDFLRRVLGLSKSDRGGNLSNSCRALCVGMETSKRYGACSGAKMDCIAMKTALSNAGFDVCALTDSQGTKYAVSRTLKKMVESIPKNGIFVFTYSGHGGSTKFSTTHDEDDGKDEYLCLYDGMLIDDDVWEIVSKCKGRVVLVFDCCHSETMFRAPAARSSEDSEDYAPATFVPRDATIADSPVKMLVWSGCPDHTYSYGDSSGGLMTNAIMSAIKGGRRSYREVWSSVIEDKGLKGVSQKPQQTVLGGFSLDSEIWK